MKQRSVTDGFSLLEVMVTLFLVTILMGLVVPHLGSDQQESLRSAANRFRQVLIWLRDQGSFGLSEYRLRLDLSRNMYFCEQRLNDRFVPVDDPLLQSGVLDPAVGRMAWQPDMTDLPDLNEIIVRFSRFGPEKPIMVQFVDHDATIGFTVSYRPEWSKPRLEAGQLGWK
ncbi:MAG: prepilin-type N-terminal cleavage/methylation domain-containing protein [Magnetococcus sp. DMHC-1]|nr:prepilin-type N-terminal cleavage/methylation domain-containing protein [Magnetococcales bacterium]